MSFVIGVVLGLLYANILEWFIHKNIFHEMGKNKNSLWSYHLKGHHVLSKKNDFIDLTKSTAETFGMLILMLAHFPILYINGGFFLSVMLYSLAFNFLHGYQHKNVEFTRKYMNWHWEHHMKDSNKNFGVVAPWADYLFGTRKKYKK